jgi:hypothetical protein
MLWIKFIVLLNVRNESMRRGFEQSASQERDLLAAAEGNE